MDGFKEIGLPAIKPYGSFFVMVDISELGLGTDVEFCKYLPEKVGVAAIPPSAFYVNKSAGEKMARFAFCKKDEVLQAAVEKLRVLG